MTQHLSITYVLSQFEMKMLRVCSRKTAENEDVVEGLKAKNENLEKELSCLRQKTEAADKLDGIHVAAEMKAAEMEKKNVEEVSVGMSSAEQSQKDDSIVEAVRKLKAEKIELEDKLAGISTELYQYRHPSDGDANSELMSLREERQRLEALVTYLENEVQLQKDNVHEQRIRALDLKHELREVRFTLLCLLYVNFYSLTLALEFLRKINLYKIAH